MRQTVVILDFGGQYTQLIARRVRQEHVYSHVLPYSATADEIAAFQPIGIIFSGGPASVLDADAPSCDPGVFTLGVPVLGICYGMQLTAHLLGGQVVRAAKREYGLSSVRPDRQCILFADCNVVNDCWMSHTWQVAVPPEGFRVIASTDTCPVAAFADEARRIYGFQFHPESVLTEYGKVMLENFLK
ncbi:MAG: glutamine-hydrolyzing GMP synthase [Clostridia bacterium]|nr:glutamine-hydrolyzing GMP synthase [Clostridia bacterium]